MSNSFGERLLLERKRLGLTQEQFGALAGISRLAQFKYEHDQHVPSVEFLQKLHQARVDAYFLITGRRLSGNQVDWGVMREAFAFLHKNFISKPGKAYTEDHLFAVFQSLAMAMMDAGDAAQVVVNPPVKSPKVAELE